MKIEQLKHFLKYGLLTILILMPFHGFITTWLGSIFGNLLLWRAWKELLLILLIFTVVYLIYKDRELFKILMTRKINRWIIVFAIFAVLITLIFMRDFDAALLGLTIQLRLFVIFVLAQIAAYYKLIKTNNLLKIILISACIVVGFTILQKFALPHDFLSHFGYDKYNSIPPFFTVDEQLDKLRYASTLRGPNSLGAYLLMPLMLILASWKKIKTNSKLVLNIILGALSLVALYGSQSRSAWLGLLVAAACYGFLQVPAKWKKSLIILGGTVVLVLIFGLYQMRNSNFVQNQILHDNPETGGKISSNQARIESYQASVGHIKDRPLTGCGAGCAGPASVHNIQGTRITENYFLQTAEELGLIGLSLLLIIFVSMLKELYFSGHPLAKAWLAVFVGLFVASMLLPTWADDTIAYLWWGVAGLILYNKSQVKLTNEKINKQKTIHSNT